MDIWVIGINIAVRLLVAAVSLYGLIACADRAESDWRYTLTAMACFIAFWAALIVPV
jgi:hypothetical protein